MQDTLIYNQRNWVMRDEAARHKHTYNMRLRAAHQKKLRQIFWYGATKLIQPSKHAAMKAHSVNDTLQDIFRKSLIINCKSLFGEI